MKYLENNPLGCTWDAFMAKGYQMFIAARLAPTEVEHCQKYYEFMDAPLGAVLVDMGCGVGGFGAYMQKIDPDMRVINVVNDSALIAEMRAANKYCVEASYEHTQLPGMFADVVVFNESIGYGDITQAVKEAVRLMKPGAVLIIKDFAPADRRIRELHIHSMAYTMHRPDTIVAAACSYGLCLDRVDAPEQYVDHWVDITGDAAGDRYTGRQIIYRFIKGDINEHTNL
jgi:SAM-dependent methyltransferase